MKKILAIFLCCACLVCLVLLVCLRLRLNKQSMPVVRGNISKVVVAPLDTILSEAEKSEIAQWDSSESSLLPGCELKFKVSAEYPIGRIIPLWKKGRSHLNFKWILIKGHTKVMSGIWVGDVEFDEYGTFSVSEYESNAVGLGIGDVLQLIHENIIAP